MIDINLNLIEPKILGNSQKGRDSLINAVFNHIGVTNKYYIEFGAYNGITFSNTSFLRVNGWSGLLLDPEYENDSINLHKVFLTRENVLNVFKHFKVPTEFDFLSVDIDGNDYWILKEILSVYSPRVIMTEVNVRFNNTESYTQPYREDFTWDGRSWCGASPLAMVKACSNYTPIHLYLDDLFLVRKDLCSEKSLSEIYPKPNPRLYDSHNAPNIDYKNLWVSV